MTEANQLQSCELYPNLVYLKNLQLPKLITAPSVWGTPKAQPALLTIHLLLSRGFESAADNDALDQNTVHYGDLAKRIRGSCGENETLDTLFSMTEKVIGEMVMRADGTCRVRRAIVQVTLTKAVMYSQGMDLTKYILYENNGKATPHVWDFRLREVKLMALIGVKDEERTGKQPLEADLTLQSRGEAHHTISPFDDSLFAVEQVFAKIIENSSFETLEALANFAVKELQKGILTKIAPCSQLVLNLEKPRAINVADAPGVTVCQPLLEKGKAPGKGDSSNGQQPTGNPVLPLKIIKPYV